MRIIRYEDLRKQETTLPKHQDGKWIINIKGIAVSVIKWNKDRYNGYYEIYGSDDLFYGVERYCGKATLLQRLNDLESE